MVNLSNSAVQLVVSDGRPESWLLILNLGNCCSVNVQPFQVGTEFLSEQLKRPCIAALQQVYTNVKTTHRLRGVGTLTQLHIKTQVCAWQHWLVFLQV